MCACVHDFLWIAFVQKGIVVTAKHLRSQRFDGWIWSYQCLSLLQQLLQTGIYADLGKFSLDFMPTSFVRHAKAIVNGAR